jgi:hypothetical protein
VPAYRDPGVLEFDAPIQRYGGGGSFVTIPFDVHEQFGVRGRVPVAATFDGADYRGSIAPYGGDAVPKKHMLGVLLELQDHIGKHHGDVVHVTVRLDTVARVVELDAATEAALRDAGVLDRFRAMSYSHQRNYWQWIDGAKRDETRESRIAKAIEMVGEGQRLK